MTEWWGNIPAFERLFWYFAIPFSIVFTIQLILTFTGMGNGSNAIDGVEDVDIDGEIEGELGSTFRLFTVRNFITFFTIFGWAGIAFYNSGLGEGITVLLSVVLGLMVMGVVAGLFYFVMKLGDSGNLDINNAIGLTGEVYIPIPAKRRGLGKVQITVQGALREMEAVTEEGGLSTGTIVKVINIVNNHILLVEKLKN